LMDKSIVYTNMIVRHQCFLRRRRILVVARQMLQHSVDEHKDFRQDLMHEKIFLRVLDTRMSISVLQRLLFTHNLYRHLAGTLAYVHSPNNLFRDVGKNLKNFLEILSADETSKFIAVKYKQVIFLPHDLQWLKYICSVKRTGYLLPISNNINAILYRFFILFSNIYSKFFTQLMKR